MSTQEAHEPTRLDEHCANGGDDSTDVDRDGPTNPRTRTANADTCEHSGDATRAQTVAQTRPASLVPSSATARTEADPGGRTISRLSAGAAPGLPDLSGTWGQLQVQTSITRVPVVGQVTSTTRTLLLLRIEQESANLEIQSRVCSIEIENRPNLVRTMIPDAFIRSLPTQRRRARLQLRDEGFSLEHPRAVETIGVRLDDPLRDTLPNDPDDPRVFDQDNTGHPGVTVEISGMVRGQVHVIQRGWSRLRTTHLDPDRFDGLIEWDNEQVVMGASNAFIRRDSPASPHPSREQSYFRTDRLEDGLDCRALLRRADRLFSRED